MARKKKHPGHENHERWLVSYADFITLLFAFFVVMFASSQADKGKAQQVSDSVKRALEENHVAAAVAAILGGTTADKGKGNAQMKGPGGAVHAETPPPPPPKTGSGPTPDMAGSVNVLKSELQEEIAKGMLQVTLDQRGVVVSLRQAAFFPSGQDVIDPSTHTVFVKLGDIIRKMPNKVRLEGHTDSDPIHNGRFRSNWELSAARSVALLELLTSRYEIASARLSVAGYAETVPVADNTTPNNKALNRRVDVVILNEFGMHGEPKPAPGITPPATTTAAVPAAAAHPAPPAPDPPARKGTRTGARNAQAKSARH